MGNNKKLPKFTIPEKNRYLSSISDLADYMGMSFNTLNGWVKSNYIKKKQKGWFSGDVVKVLEQKIAEADEAEEEIDESSMTPNAKEWLEEKRKWQAKTAELGYHKKRGELLDREDVLDDATVVLRTVRHKLSRMPKELKTPLSRLTNPDDIEDRLAEELAKRLNELADWVESYQKGEDDDDGKKKGA
jgi:phage terminase Nu1 subunit (DNA packaging protein)